MKSTTVLVSLAVFVLSAACASAPGGSSDAPPPTLPPAPWKANSALPPSEVPGVLMEQWRKADNRNRCAPLAFDELHVSGIASPRAAKFGGGWGVAWDVSGAAGVNPDGSRCSSCGRGTFGIAGTGASASGDTYRGWPNRIAWYDGSTAEYGPEGGSGPKQLAYLKVAGEQCLYNVWSYVSQDHLEQLLAELRRVQ